MAYGQQIMSIPTRITRLSVAGFKSVFFNEYSDILITPSDRYGVTAIVSNDPISPHDIVLTIGIPDHPNHDLSYGENNISKVFQKQHRILRVVATEGDTVLYNTIPIDIKKDYCWVSHHNQSQGHL